MDTRLTIDLKNPQIFKLLRLESAEEGKAIREIVVQALEYYLSHRRENRAILALAEKSFAEWDNPQDSVYDNL